MVTALDRPSLAFKKTFTRVHKSTLCKSGQHTGPNDKLCPFAIYNFPTTFPQFSKCSLQYLINSFTGVDGVTDTITDKPYILQKI